MFKTNYFNTF